MMDYLVVLVCVGASIYSLHRGWTQAAGWFVVLTFFAILGATGSHN